MVLIADLIALGVTVGACGDDLPTQPDAPNPDTAVDAIPMYPACAEFTGPGVNVPAHVTGTLAGAEVVNPSMCSTVDAPFGAESAGPDRVVQLTGLRARSPYIVKLTSGSDLGFYVTTGCATPTGPGSDQCLLFEDASLGGVEVGRFIAGGTVAYVIVDFYASHAPASSSFTLEVYEEDCQTDQQCGGATPACSDGLCVQCVTSFGCATSAAPRCSSTNTCQPGVDACTSDDPADPGDDGPAGARGLALDAQGVATATGTICSSPRSESDFFAFEVTTLGEIWDFSLAWSGGRDLDLELYDATGRPHGLSFWEQPERARLSFLSIGRYYVRVTEFSSTADPAPQAYTVSAQRTLGPACSVAADCATEFRNQLFRGACAGGACVPIDGNGAIAEGGACDSQSDCGLALQCPSFFFVSDADSRDTCSRNCGDDADCAPLGAGFVCTTYLPNNFCVQKCTEDDHCPTATQSQPAVGSPWYRLHCDVPTGRCLP